MNWGLPNGRFVQADLYDAPAAIPEAAAFDMVFVTWGAIGWLPDIYRWAEIVCHFLKPGGSLYLAEALPNPFILRGLGEIDELAHHLRRSLARDLPALVIEPRLPIGVATLPFWKSERLSSSCELRPRPHI